MPQHDSNAPACRDCKGFAAVAVTTGTRHDGSRTLLRVVCRACNGTGIARRALVQEVSI